MGIKYSLVFHWPTKNGVEAESLIWKATHCAFVFGSSGAQFVYVGVVPEFHLNESWLNSFSSSYMPSQTDSWTLLLSKQHSKSGSPYWPHSPVTYKPFGHWSLWIQFPPPCVKSLWYVVHGSWMAFNRRVF